MGASPRNPRRMTALDAVFYHLERTGQLMHVGGVHTVEGPIDFDRLITDLRERLHLIPRYMDCAVSVPLNLGNPTWDPDPHFDVRHHVVRHRLRQPGDDGQLSQLVSRLFAQPLHRDRPLWELHVIDGYRGDCSALFSKVHHCMIDGVSGVQLMAVVFDPTPNPPPPPPAPEAPPRPPLPTGSTQVIRAVEEGMLNGIDRVRTVWRLLRRPRRGLAEVGQVVDAIGELGRVLVAGTPATPFNGHVSTLRRVVWTTFGLNEVKAIKNRLGGTVNDVVLSTISAALRRYLEGHGVRPERTELVAALPVNVRREDEHLALGNRVSALVAPLPVGIFDPLERLRQVRAATAQLKERRQSVHVTRILDLMSLLPPPLQRSLEQLTVAPVNTICTNVPGPPVSLYMQGRRIETMVPIVPIAQGVGLAFAILSYADTLTIAATADPALVPDSDVLCDLLQEGHEELRVLAAVERIERRGPVKPERLRRRESSQVA